MSDVAARGRSWPDHIVALVLWSAAPREGRHARVGSSTALTKTVENPSLIGRPSGSSRCAMATGTSHESDFSIQWRVKTPSVNGGISW